MKRYFPLLFVVEFTFIAKRSIRREEVRRLASNTLENSPLKICRIGDSLGK